MEPKKRTESFEGNSVDIYYFNNPMHHEDWHKAEEMGLIYIGFIHNGPDYWDDEMAFCMPEQEVLAKEWKNWMDNPW